jgi:hypothetical protein
MAQQLSTNTFTVAKWVVSADATQGTHTTIQAAINSASSGDNIFIRGGTYTENLTLKAGISLSASPGAERTPMVTIIGNTTFSVEGTVTLSDIRLQTNGNFCISVTGVAASILKLNNCYINATNNTAISFTSSSASSQIFVIRCNIDLTTTGIAIHSSSSSGTLEYRYCNTTNTGGSSTASSNSGGVVKYFYTNLLSPISTTGSGSFQNIYSQIDTSAQNATSISVAGNGTSTTNYNLYSSGTATAIDVSGSHTLNLIRAVVSSSNVNAISVGGSGVLKTGFVSFTGTSSGISGASSVTTIAGHYITGTAINISNDATASTINIGTGAAAKTVTVGSTTTTSSLALKYGTSDFSLASATGNIMVAQDTGEINYPLQPAFLAIPNATISDVTGDGTTYVIIFNTEIFDQNSDYNTGTGQFTASVTGRYQFYGSIAYGDIGAAHTNGSQIIDTSNRDYLTNLNNPTTFDINGYLAQTLVVLADMDAGDTAELVANVAGSTKTVDIFYQSSTDPRSWFSGSLVC